MNDRQREISMTPAQEWPGAALAVCVGAAALSVFTAAAADPLVLAPADVKAAESKADTPKFSQVPPAPKDVRPIADWRSAIVETRLEGRRIARSATAEPWTLRGDTEDWAAEARAQAEPPAPITTPYEGEAESIAAALRARASAPPRSR